MSSRIIDKYCEFILTKDEKLSFKRGDISYVFERDGISVITYTPPSVEYLLVDESVEFTDIKTTRNSLVENIRSTLAGNKNVLYGNEIVLEKNTISIEKDGVFHFVHIVGEEFSPPMFLIDRGSHGDLTFRASLSLACDVLNERVPPLIRNISSPFKNEKVIHIDNNGYETIEIKQGKKVSRLQWTPYKRARRYGDSPLFDSIIREFGLRCEDVSKLFT